MARARPGTNASKILDKLFNFCWKADGRKPSGLIRKQRRWNSWCHETPGIARPSSETRPHTGARRPQPFDMEQPAGRTEGIHSPAQRNQEASGTLHLTQPFRPRPTSRLITVSSMPARDNPAPGGPGIPASTPSRRRRRGAFARTTIERAAGVGGGLVAPGGATGHPGKVPID
jgi:hypothetical protein